MQRFLKVQTAAHRLELFDKINSSYIQSVLVCFSKSHATQYPVFLTNYNSLAYQALRFHIIKIVIAIFCSGKSCPLM